MSMDDGGLSRFEHDELRDLVLAGTQRIRPAGARIRQIVAAGAALLLIVAGAGAVSWSLLDRRPPEVVTGVPNPRTAYPNGWVAFATAPKGTGSGVYLVKEGLAPHRVVGSRDDQAVYSCPAFSRDGSQLVAGRAIGSEDSGWTQAALVITTLNADGEAGDTTTLALDGVTDQPCATWSADGRWLALRVGTRAATYLPRVGEVWVIDTQTNQIRRLRGLGATDIEWSPNAPDLFIASGGIIVYSARTEATRTVESTAGAVAFAISPDARSLAVEHDAGGDREGSSTLLLMAVDGSDQRTLVPHYRVSHGIGPVVSRWQPGRIPTTVRQMGCRIRRDPVLQRRA